jgi:hypothetical protein
MWKIALNLFARAKNEGRKGLTGFADLGSFFQFENIKQLMQYDLWLPQKVKKTG